jgi:uncharacterized protein (DUF1330 family)
MTVTVLATVSVAEDQAMALAAYFKATGPLLEAAGAKIIKRFRIIDVVAGQKPAQTVMIVEYPDRAAVDMVFNSPQYKAIIPMRDLAFPVYNVTIVDG